MQEHIVIFMPTKHDEHPSWVILNHDAEVLETTVEGDPSRLATLAQDRQATAVVPAEAILLTQANLPKMVVSRLLKALPYAIEEQLIDDVETLHMAIGSQRESGDVAVAAVSQGLMQAWLDTLTSWGVRASRVIPIIFALPWAEKRWFIGGSDYLYVRTGEYQGFTCDPANVMTYLNLALSNGEAVPETIEILKVTRKIIGDHLKVTAKVNETLVARDKWYVSLAENVLTQPAINLLQGQFALKRASGLKWGKARQVMIYLAEMCVVLIFLAPLGSYLIFKIRDTQLQSAMRVIYQRQFPTAKNMVAPKMRMSDKLQQVQAQIGQNRLLLLLGYLGRGVSTHTTIKLKQVSFQGDRLLVELTAPNSDEFTQFSDYLTQIGLSVQQQDAVLSGSRLNATLVLE